MSKSNYHLGRKRDNCYFCHARGTEEHHIIPQRFDGPDESQNIVGVCSQCHTKLERLYDKGFYEWFGIEDEKGERKYHRTCESPDCNKLVTRVVFYNTFKQKLCELHAKERAATNLRSNRRCRVDTSKDFSEQIEEELEHMTIEKSSEVDE